jgi:hypothetical protein
MVDLDGGTNAVPLRILAEICRANGDSQGTRRYLELCRDAGGWDPSYPYSPRVSSAIQGALRDVASAPRNFVIDLPDIFSRHLNTAPSNRRIFLDYCHLTAEGITVAMAAIASKVLDVIADRVVPAQDLQRKSISPSAKVEGKACFLAAVHNAHYYQGYDLVRYWCARALQFWPDCADIMTRFVDFQTRRVPTMACKSAIELFERGELDLLRYLTPARRLDMVLSDAIIECVDAIGFPGAKDVSDLRIREHSIRTGPKELTDFYYSSTMAGPTERAWTSRSFPNNRGSHGIYASAFWEKSKFVFFSEKRRPAGLKLTYRVPTLSISDGTVEIDVNGHPVAHVPVGRTWQTLEFSILSDYVVDGTNEIVITWPKNEDGSEGALARAADTLIARRLPYFYEVFGEIHSLLVFDASGFSAAFSETHSVDWTGR